MLPRILVASLALCALSGCVAPLPHSPNTGLVGELGRDAAESRLRDLMVRARAPRITNAEVQDDAVVYEATGLSPWWYTPHQGKAAVLFSALARIDLYENARTFLYDAAGRELSVILHNNVEDGREFIDLMMSFQAWWREGGGGEAAEKKPEAEKPAEEPNETSTDLTKEDGGSGETEAVEPQGDEKTTDLMKEDQ